MKDKHDRKTADLLQSAAARRQAAFKERQKAAGKVRLSVWVTVEQEAAIRALLENWQDGQGAA